jgi:NAD(P)-dependent dehydrogenase (short-subunit alcohol dehydrogenase family)
MLLKTKVDPEQVLITGVSPESIGSSIALSIASQNPALLILASRTQSKLEEVLKNIHNAYSDVIVKVVLLDLMSQESIKAAAKEVSQLTDRLDLIINNAGIMTPKRQTTKEGLEGQFGANHVGHFLFTNLLMPKILASASASDKGATRVINLTSLGHRLSPVRFSDYNLEKSNEEVPEEERYVPLPPMFAKSADDGYSGYVAYGQAKTANILFSVGLNKRFGEKGVRSYAVHPGCESKATQAIRMRGIIFADEFSNLDWSQPGPGRGWRGCDPKDKPVLEEP